MVRYRKKTPLYEAISKTRFKSGFGKAAGQLHPETPGKEQPTTAKSAFQVPERETKWLKRPRIVQLNAGRIEISIPYELAIAVLLGIVLLALVVFRLGQITRLSSRETANLATKISKPAERPSAGRMQTPDVTGKTAPVSESAERGEAVKLKANNRIVIQTYQLRPHLEPVKQYFARFDIETEIRKIDNWWYLITKDKYENPERQGTDGYLAKQRIIKLGAKYKAPQGYETFAPNLFKDAYGMKFDD